MSWTLAASLLGDASVITLPALGLLLLLFSFVAFVVGVRFGHYQGDSLLKPVACKTDRGRIQLVGAGPGSVELLTIAAVRAIREADLVLCDKLTSVSVDIMNLIEGDIRIAQKSKAPGSANYGQDQLNSWGLEAVRKGKRVVRLKCGDPFVFGRGGEEVLFYRSHGFEPQVLPGISSALAAPLAAGIPVTHRGVADQVLIATGMLRDGTAGSIPSFTCGRTTVLLMAVKRLKTLPQELLQAGYPATCSITVIEQAHTIHQRVHRTSINDLHLLSKVQIASPAAVVIGNAGEVLQ